MMAWPAISMLVFLPFLGAIFVRRIRGAPEDVLRNARFVALWTTIAALLLVLFIAFSMRTGPGSPALEERWDWMPGFGISWHMGADGLSIGFALTAAVLALAAVLAEWAHGRHPARLVTPLFLESAVFGIFFARNTFLFLLFFGASLLPPFLALSVSADPRARRAGFHSLLLPLAAALPMLALFVHMGIGGYQELTAQAAPLAVVAALALAFGARMPVWPLHAAWMEAFSRAGTALAILLPVSGMTVGAYGFARFLPLLVPDVPLPARVMLSFLALATIVWGGWASIGSAGGRNRIGYMALCISGLAALAVFAGRSVDVASLVFLVFGGGLGVAGLLLGLGGGESSQPPQAGFLRFFACCAALLPGSAGFWGLLSTLRAAAEASMWCAAIALSGLCLGTFSLIALVGEVAAAPSMKDERGAPSIGAALAILSLLALGLGLLPSALMEAVHG